MKRRTVRYTKLVRLPEETVNIRSARLLLADYLASRLAGSPNDVLVESQSVTDGIGAGVTRASSRPLRVLAFSRADAGYQS